MADTFSPKLAYANRMLEKHKEKSKFAFWGQYFKQNMLRLFTRNIWSHWSAVWQRCLETKRLLLCAKMVQKLPGWPLAHDRTKVGSRNTYEAFVLDFRSINRQWTAPILWAIWTRIACPLLHMLSYWSPSSPSSCKWTKNFKFPVTFATFYLRRQFSNHSVATCIITSKCVTSSGI